MIPYIIKE